MEMTYDHIQETVRYLKGIVSHDIQVGIILGSGLGKMTTEIEHPIEISYEDIPHFPLSTVEGHTGKLIFGEINGKSVVAMSGRFHYYEGYSMKQVTYPVRVMKFLGIQQLLISNASGGMNKDFDVGDLMIIRDHLYLQPEHPLRGKNDPRLGPRFPNMSRPYDPDMIQKALEIAAQNQIVCHTGVYAGVQGPTFETPAEYKMFFLLGADAVGMSTTPEVVVARHMDIPVFAISVISDMGYPWDKADEVNHQFVLEKAASAEPKMTLIIKELIQRL